MSGASIIDHVRRAEWLDRVRVCGYAVILAIASLVLMVNSYLKAMRTGGTDYLAFWGAGKAVLSGNPAGAYNLALQAKIQFSTGADAFFAFVNPPPFLFAITPFAALPFSVAWLAWVIVTYAIWVFIAVRLFPRLWLPILVFPGALLAAGHAQNGFVTGALLLAGVGFVDRRPLLAGAAIGALIIKPHLAILLPFWLAAGGRWKAFIAAWVSVTALLGLSWLAFGSDTMIAYTQSWEASAELMQREHTGFYLRMATLYGQLRIFTDANVALAFAIVLVLAMVAVTLMSWRRFDGNAMGSGALMLAATGFASPYLFNYDLPFLILPLMWLVREGLARGFREWEKLTLVALYAAPYVTRAVALPLNINLMPLASAALVWLVWTRGDTKAQVTAG